MEQDKTPNSLPNAEKLKERTELYKLWAAAIGLVSQVLRFFF